MKLVDALRLPSLNNARVVAGAEGLENTIRWVHIADLPDPLPWVREGDFLLTSGFAWPHDDTKQRALIEELCKRGLTGLGLAVPHFFDRMPEAACEVAEQLQFPLIEIPWEVPFKSITEELLHAIMDFHYKLLEKSEFIHKELMRIAMDAKNLEDIAVTLGKLIERNVLIQHPDGRLLAEYDPHGKRANKEKQVQAAKLSFSLTNNEDLLRSLRSNPQPKRFAAEPDSGMPATFVCPIYIKRELVGLLWILEGQQPLSELDQRASGYAAVVMALHISQQRALASLEAQLGYSFLDSLLEGQYIADSHTLHRAGLLGFDPEGVYSVGMLVLNSQVPLSREGIVKRERVADRLKGTLQQLKIPAVLSLVQNQLFFLIPEHCRPELIWDAFRASDLTFAVSLPHRGFESVRQGHKEVSSLLPHLSFGSFHRYEDLLVPRVLLGDAEARTSFLTTMFGPLYSNKNGDVLINTLLTYARLGFHLRKTADELKIHSKTLRYRLDRAILLGNFDLDDAETQFQLQLAVRIASMENRR